MYEIVRLASQITAPGSERARASRNRDIAGLGASSRGCARAAEPTERHHRLVDRISRLLVPRDPDRVVEERRDLGEDLAELHVRGIRLLPRLRVEPLCVIHRVPPMPLVRSVDERGRYAFDAAFASSDVLTLHVSSRLNRRQTAGCHARR
jgi:hypothetical protein